RRRRVAVASPGRAGRARRPVPAHTRTRARSPSGGPGASMTWAELSGVLRSHSLITSEEAAGSAPSIGAVTGVAYYSRAITPGQIFVALKGQQADGTVFARQAIEKGAVAVVSEQAAPAGSVTPWVVVSDARRALALFALTFQRNPSRDMQVVGITGTN